MNRMLHLPIPVLAFLFLFTSGLSAQEKTEMTIQVKKDGKVVSDTTYTFDKEADAKHAMKMMEVLSGEHEGMQRYNYTMNTAGGDDSRTMVFISEEGGKTRIKKVQGDTLVWISEGDSDGEDMKVITRKKIVEGSPGEEYVIVMKGDDGETFDILMDKDIETGKGDKKVVKVIVSGDAEGEWHVDAKDLNHMEKEVYVISGDGTEVELEEIMEKHGHGEHVKVIVVETKADKKSEKGDEELIEKEAPKKKPAKQ